MTRRLFGKAGFVQVILTSAGNLASSTYFVDMILRRVGSWCEHLDMFITKSDGGHLRGSLSLGGLYLPHLHCHYNNDEETSKRPYTGGVLIGAVRNLALFAAVLRPVKLALKEYFSPAFVHPDPRPLVKFHFNLDQAYGKEAR